MSGEFSDEVAYNDDKILDRCHNSEDHSIMSLELADVPVSLDTLATESLIAVGCMDDHCTVISMEIGSSIRLRGHSDTVSGVKFSTDGKLLATCGYDSKVMIWNVDTINQSLQLPQNDRNSDTFSDNSKITYDYSSIFPAHVIDTENEAEWIEWHPKGNSLICGTSMGTIWLWYISDAVKLMHLFTGGHYGRVTVGTFSKSNQRIITCGGDGSMCEWNTKSSQYVHMINFKNRKSINHDSDENMGGEQEDLLISLETLPNDVSVVGSSNGIVYIIKHGTILGKIQIHSTPVECISLSSDGTYLVFGSLDGLISIWETARLLATQVPRFKLFLDTGVARQRFLGTSPLLCCGTVDGKVVIVNCLDGTLQCEFLGNEGSVMDIHYLPAPVLDQVFAGDLVQTRTSFYIITASEPRDIRVFELSVE